MGNTWVVFIENSNYERLPRLDGPAKDLITIKKALANYQINTFIHQKDMTKAQMEKFFPFINIPNIRWGRGCIIFL